jgi:sugar phosphate isomerase/epimerase
MNSDIHPTPVPCPRRQSLLLAGFIALATLTASAGPNPFFVLDNGLHGEGLTNIAAQLDLVKQTGFDGLSWRTDSPERVQQVLDGTRKRGLKLFALYANLDLKDGKLVYDPRLKEIIALCKGTEVILWPNLTSKQFPNSSPAGDDIAVAGLRELADLCAANGLRIAIYPHINMWMHRTEDALRLVKKVDRPNVGLTFNLCHALLDGAESRLPALIEEAAPYMFLATINGADRGASPKDMARLIQPLDRGTFEVAAVLQKLQALGYKGPIGLQCYNLKSDPKTLLPGSMNAWRKMSAALK